MPPDLCKIPGAFTEVVSSRDALLCAGTLLYTCPHNTSSLTVVVIVNSLCTQDETPMSLRGRTGGPLLHCQHQNVVSSAEVASAAAPFQVEVNAARTKITRSTWGCREAAAIRASFGQAVLPNSVLGLAHGCFWKDGSKCGLSSAVSGAGVAWQSRPTRLPR